MAIYCTINSFYQSFHTFKVIIKGDKQQNYPYLTITYTVELA